MRGVLLLLGLAAVTSAWSVRDRPKRDAGKSTACQCQFVGGPDDDAGLTARQDGQDLHLDQLEKNINNFESDYRALAKKGKSFIRGVHGDEARLDNLEGSGCPKKEFQCGDEECIGHLEVCDGVKDCHNGHDEDDEICKSPATAGTVYEAELDGNDPCTIRKPIRIRVAVLTFDRPDVLASIAHVRASIVLTYHHGDAIKTDTLTSTGYYSYGRQTLVINPPDIPDDNRLVIAIVFDGADDHHAHGKIYHEASKDVCVRFGVRKIDH